MTTRRGFTMVELMIGLILTMAVGGVTYQMLLTNTRVTRAQTEHVGVQDNVRSGALIIANELRDLGYDNVTGQATARWGYGPATAARSDILQMFAGSLTYRATRGVGFVCAVTAAAPFKIRLYQDSWQAFRTARNTDSLLVYVEGASNTAADDAWVHLGITGAPVSVNCPAIPGNANPPGWEFEVTPPADMAGATLGTALLVGTHFVLGGPARLVETMQMSHYQAPDGSWWLGMRSLSANELMQPVVGPLADSTVANAHGLQFIYRDANNATTAVRANVRSSEIALNGVTAEAVHGRGRYALLDTMSVNTRITLRNTLR
jgi:Tfp pilus assembly major pilin PilA